MAQSWVKLGNRNNIIDSDYQITAEDLNAIATAVDNLQNPPVTTVNVATYDVLASDRRLNIAYTVTGAVTSLTLPTAQAVNGRTIKIKDSGGSAGSNNITIDTEGAEKIDGENTFVMNSNYESEEFYSDGINWFIC